MIVSFIIPAYNAQRYLGQALDSVLAQTGGDMEILVVDDGSTDGTGALAADYARRHSCIRVITSENRGVSHARNLGMEAARGRYLAFLDADDVLCRGAYTPELAAWLSSSDHDLVSFGYIAAGPDLRRGRLIPEEDRVLNRRDPGFLREANGRHFCARLYRRQTLGRLRFFEGIRYGEDSVFSYLAFHSAQSAACFSRYWFAYRNNIHSAIHNTGGWDYILTDCLCAWARAARQTGDPSGQWDCWGMVCSVMGQYLRSAAGAGVPPERLRQAMTGSADFREARSRPGSYWITEENKRLFRDLERAPGRTWLKYRLRGFLPQSLRTLTRTAPVRRIYLRLKYRTAVGEYLAAG